MSSDTLTVTSRAFYERSKAKVAISIIVAASGLMLLGFCAVAGGNAASSNAMDGIKGQDDHTDASYAALSGGYGFACFVFLLGFILLTAAGIYISPFICGSNNEKKMIRSPQEIDTGYSAYAESSSSAPPQV